MRPLYVMQLKRGKKLLRVFVILCYEYVCCFNASLTDGRIRSGLSSYSAG